MSATIELLNAEVQRKLKLESMVSSLNGDQKAAKIILQATQESPELPIYQHRSRLVIALYVGLAVRGLLMAPGALFCTTACVMMVLLVELYGGILHIVLDNPDYINMPVIGRGCLEFQWHHLIRQDIATKPLLDVWGDLNVLMFSHLAMFVLTLGLSDPRAQFVWACLVFLAYWGQFSHRQAHMSATKKPPAWVAFMQRNRMLLAPAKHRRHHETFDCEYPILSGFSSPVLEFLGPLFTRLGLTHAWLVGFVVFSLGLVYIGTSLTCLVADRIEALLVF
jgi:hypothetical protein